jgi:hypothetical protein
MDIEIRIRIRSFDLGPIRSFLCLNSVPRNMNTSSTKSRRKLPEGDHELGELLLVELGDGAEHALPRHPTELGVRHRLLGHTHDLSWGQEEDNRKQAVMWGGGGREMAARR